MSGFTSELDLSGVPLYWRERMGTGAWLGEDLFRALAERYVEAVRVSDAELFRTPRERGILFVANHQVGVESALFAMIASAWTRMTTVALAKAEHRESWIGRMFDACFARRGSRAPGLLALVDRDDARAMVRTLSRELDRVAKGEQSFLVHSEGTRARRCRQPLEVVSAALLDRAVAAEIPVVPVRFSGGLPIERLPERLEFPYRHGRQTIWIGAALTSDELRPLSPGERKARVLAAHAELGEPWQQEVPHPGDAEFAREVERRRERHGVTEPQAVLASALARLDDPSEETRRLLAFAEGRASAVEPREDREWLARCAREIFGVQPGA